VRPAENDAGAPLRRTSVARGDRIRDWVAMALVVIGALTYVTAHRGMGSVARDQTPTTAEAARRGEWKMVRWIRYERMSRVGIVLVGAGAIVGVWSFARHAMRRGVTHA
jgi:protein-S-isoprenylcysteine O-methyltransferase Ste14